MLSCIEWCSSIFACCGQAERIRARPRRARRRQFADEDELMAYDALGLEEDAVRVDQVEEAARIAERKQVAPVLRDESLIARLTLSLNGGASDFDKSMDPSASSSNEGDIDQTSKIPSSDTFVRTLASLSDPKVRIVVVEALINATRHRWRKRETTRLLAFFQLAVASTLGPASIHELQSIIADLPPAVMGDTQAQQSSRVLLDVSHDAREEMMRRRAVLPASGRSQVDSAVAAFETQLKHIELTGAEYEASQIVLRHPNSRPFKPGSMDPHIALYFDILISLLLEVPEFDRFRILLTQILLSKQVPADNTLRLSVLELVFPSRPPTPAQPPSPTPSLLISPEDPPLV